MDCEPLLTTEDEIFKELIQLWKKYYFYWIKWLFSFTFNKQDLVLHIGAFTPKSGIEANDINKSNANIFNTKYLLDNLPNFPEKFIFLSTLDVYGNNYWWIKFY